MKPLPYLSSTLINRARDADSQMEMCSKLTESDPHYGEGPSKNQCETHLLIYVQPSECRRLKAPPHSPPRRIIRLRLFNVNMPSNNTLTFTTLARRVKAIGSIGNVGFYTAYSVPLSDRIAYADTPIPITSDISAYNIPVRIPSEHEGVDTPEMGRLVEVGVFCEDMNEFPASHMLELLHVYNLVVGPRGESATAVTVHNIRVIERQSGSNVEKRMAWNWTCPKDRWPAGKAWSNSTGPFSHFNIMTNERRLGEAFCLECPLRRDDFDEVMQSDEVRFTIQGTLYGGGTVTSDAIFSKTDLMVAETQCSFG